MDPNATLQALRELLGGDHSGSDRPASDPEETILLLCQAEELWQALDQWLSRGGFLPEEWAR